MAPIHGYCESFALKLTSTHTDTYQMSLIEQVAFAPVAGFTKIAILLFYKRIFTGRRMRMLIDYGNIVIIAFSIAFFFALLFQCM